MKILNNFSLIREHLEFENDDCFYFVQLLKRRKDGHTEPGVNGNNKNRLVRFYTVRSKEELDKIETEVINICDAVNARAYIYPTKRSFIEVGNEFLKTSVNSFTKGDYSGLVKAYSTACGISYVSRDKKYLIDLDDEDASEKNVIKIIDFVNNECQPLNIDKYIYKVPTVHGLHLIMYPFNVAKFNMIFPEIIVHKNNPTLLYYKCM